jgi:phytoene dehydrogenase-like protein
VVEILVAQGVARGVLLKGGEEVRCRAVVVNADPFRMRALVGRGRFDDGYNQRLDALYRDGTTLKVNLCLRGLPTYRCLPEDRGQHGATVHLLPPEGEVIAAIRQAWADLLAGRLPDQPLIECYCHTAVDPSLRDPAGHHSGALFVQWVPRDLDWDRAEEGYVEHLLSIWERFAPGVSRLVVEASTLHPRRIEEHFGITGGHIHHVDNGFGFADRLPYGTPIAALYSASAGCHPAGSVIGAAGHNCAMRLLADLGLPSIFAHS